MLLTKCFGDKFEMFMTVLAVTNTKSVQNLSPTLIPHYNDVTNITIARS